MALTESDINKKLSIYGELLLPTMIYWINDGKQRESKLVRLPDDEAVVILSRRNKFESIVEAELQRIEGHYYIVWFSNKNMSWANHPDDINRYELWTKPSTLTNPSIKHKLWSFSLDYKSTNPAGIAYQVNSLLLNFQ